MLANQLGALDSPTGGDEPDISQPPLRTLRTLIMSLAKTPISLSLWPSYPLQLILTVSKGPCSRGAGPMR